MLIRIMIACAILILLNIYAASTIFTRWPWAQHHIILSGLIVLIFFILQLVGPFGDRLIFPKLKKNNSLSIFLHLLDWSSYAAFGAMSILFVYGFFLDIISTLWKVIALPSNPQLFDDRALIILSSVTCGTLFLGFWQAKAGPVVREVEITLRNLPTAFDGFRIAQISDLHVGPTIGLKYTQNVVTLVNALKADLIALTGDFADGKVKHVAQYLKPIADLRASYGMYYITGNHEYFWDAPAWIEQFKKLGAHVLLNQHVVIKHRDSSLILAGVTDYSTLNVDKDHASDPKKALEGAPQGLTKILLAHQPISYKASEPEGYDLQISGHTHGGQYFPFSIFIRFFQRYYKGLNRHKNMWIYVSSGTGYWGPPLRTGVPSEITLIILRTDKTDN